MKKTKAKKKTLTQEEQKERLSKLAFKRKIRNIFVETGFEYIPTGGHEFNIGLRKEEIDSLFIYENIWLLCEDTIKSGTDNDHIRTKNEAFGQIKDNIALFRDNLTKLFPDKSDLLNKFENHRIKIFGLYFSKNEISLEGNKKELFSNLIFVQPNTLNYFQWISKCIKFSARTEILRFLNIKNSDIGNISSSSSDSKISAPIIYPETFTGLTNGVRVVSFMMSAKDMLDICYVLRKDNWAESIWLYQRLIDKEKIKNIRNFLEVKGEAFYNNIIVALPDNISFSRESADEGKPLYKKIDEIVDLDDKFKLILPKEMNSVCVIDGQHRIFAHYESGTQSKQEKKIAELREKLHLLVTGLIFPHNMPDEERTRIQSEIFLDINSNAKPVPQSLLLHIKRMNNPIADESLAQLVIEHLNKQGIFENKLQISFLDSGKIKTASIVKFALRHLVTVTPVEGKYSLFNFWDGNKEALLGKNNDAIEEYVQYCSTTLRSYFGAIRNNLKDQWEDANSKLLSVISINGFIIAFNRQLKVNGVKDYGFYNQIFKDWKYDFSKEAFKYTSSQYHRFSTEILQQVFKLSEEL